MFALVRLLLVCLLAAALPVQGFASAAMRSCAHGHASPAASPATGAHEGPAAPTPAAQPHEASTNQQLDGDTAPSGQLQCSAGAACCMAAALFAAAPTLPVVKPEIEVAAGPVAATVGPYSAGLERPPKPALA